MSYASGVTYWEAFLPGLAILFLAIAVLPWLNRQNNWARTGAIALCLFVSWRYMFWRSRRDAAAPWSHSRLRRRCSSSRWWRGSP